MLEPFKYQVGQTVKTQFGSRYGGSRMLGPGKILATRLDDTEETYLVQHGFHLGQGILVTALPLWERFDFLMIEMVCFRAIDTQGMTEKELKKTLKFLNYHGYPTGLLSTN